jgi:hypothetical protein
MELEGTPRLREERRMWSIKVLMGEEKRRGSAGMVAADDSR